MSRASTRGQPGEPQWVYSTSAVDLKLEALNRIETYYDYDSNVARTTERDYLEWVNGNVSRASPTRVCKYAIDVLRLQSMKWTIGTKLIKQVMLLSPFDVVMEAPETTSAPSNTDSKSSDDFTELNVEETNPATMSVGDTSPALVEGNSGVAGDMMMVPNNDDVLTKMITDTVDKYFVQFRERMMKDMEAMMKKMLEDVMQSTMDDRVTKALQSKGKVEIDALFDANKPTLIESVGSTIAEIQKRAENDIISKSQTAIKNIAVKRDEVLHAINEETDQAIDDFFSATEQIEKTKSSPDKVDPVEEHIQHHSGKKTQSRFANVNPEDLKVTSDDQYEYHKRTAKNHDNKGFSGSGVSTYGFHKYFKAKLKNDTSILNFYQQLHKQGSPYGIHCVPLQDIHANVDLCPVQYGKMQRDDMALTIYQKLQDEDCVSVGYSKAQRIIQQYAGISDGYKVLEQLLRFVHPNLKHSTTNTYDVPKLSQSFGNLYDYGSKIMNYILMQNIQHRSYTAIEQSVMFLNNMDELKYFEAKNRALAEVRHITSTGSDVLDPNLILESLPTTLEQYHEQLHGSKQTQQPQRYVRSMYDANNNVNLCEETSEVDEPIVRSFVRRRDNKSTYPTNGRNYRDSRNDKYVSPKGSYNKQCKACGRWGCAERKCQFVAKVQLAITYIKENSNAAHKLAQEYLRTNNSKTRMSMIRTLHATMDNNSKTNEEFNNELLDQYHLEIPMEEIEFDSNEEE